MLRTVTTVTGTPGTLNEHRYQPNNKYLREQLENMKDMINDFE